MTSVVFIKNIKTNYIPAIGIFAFQMSIDIFISKRRELAIGTISTFECPLVAKWSPFILTHRLVASFPTCLAVPPTGKHVFTPLEKASKQVHLLLKRQIMHCRWGLFCGRDVFAKPFSKLGILGFQFLNAPK